MADFNESMVDYLQGAFKIAVAEVNRLRSVNEQLLADLNAVPVEMWELQEQVTSLELQLASAQQLMQSIVAFDNSAIQGLATELRMSQLPQSRPEGE